MNEEALNMVIETILSSEKVENSDRLHLVKVDLGDHVVQIATSLASFFNASDLIGSAGQNRRKKPS